MQKKTALLNGKRYDLNHIMYLLLVFPCHREPVDQVER